MKKVLVFVYRNSLGDYSANGVTARNDSMWLFADSTIEEIVDYCNENNIDVERQLVLNKRILWGMPAYYAEPVIKRSKSEGTYSDGGNFIFACDSSFSECTGSQQPIPVHDRFETWTEYEGLSI